MQIIYYFIRIYLCVHTCMCLWMSMYACVCACQLRDPSIIIFHRCTLNGPLYKREHVNRLSQFHKIVYLLTPSIQLPSYILPTQFPTRQLHQHRFINPVSSTLMHQTSFFPNTLREWNSLPNKTIEEQSPETFLNNLTIKQWN